LPHDERFFSSRRRVKPKFARVVEQIKKLLDGFPHSNTRLDSLVAADGARVILFLIHFRETGLAAKPTPHCP
jgi:hypothetical protein